MGKLKKPDEYSSWIPPHKKRERKRQLTRREKEARIRIVENIIKKYSINHETNKKELERIANTEDISVPDFRDYLRMILKTKPKKIFY